MAGVGFWLPPEFLTDDDDLLTDNHDVCKYDNHFQTQMTAPLTVWGGGNGSPNVVTSSVGGLICRVAKRRVNGNDPFAPATIPSFFKGGIWNSTSPQQIYQNRALMAQAARQRAALAALLWGGGGATKRSCAGTGVFLPRPYGRGGDGKKTVKPSLNSQLKRFEVCVRPQAEPQPFTGGVFAPDYDWMVAQRQRVAMMEEPRAMFRDVARLLPQEWTY